MSVATEKAKTHRMSPAAFLQDFGLGLLEQTLRKIAPLHKPGDPIRPVSVLRAPIGRQADIVEAGIKVLLDEDSNALLLVGEMGCGKTYMLQRLAQAKRAYAASGSDRFNVVVTLPTTNLEKWEREARATIPGVRIITLDDRDALRTVQRTIRDNHKGMTLYLIGYTRVRMHMEKELHVVTRRVDEQSFEAKHECLPSKFLSLPEHFQKQIEPPPYARCPHCGQIIMQKRKTSRFERGKRVKGEQDEVMVPLTPAQVARRPHLRTCPMPRYPNATTPEEQAKVCGAPLWRPKTHSVVVSEDSDEPRLHKLSTATCYSVGRYLLKHCRGLVDLAFIDEVQDMAADGPQGMCAGWIAQAAKKTVLATGSLFNGYPDAIWHILWRANPKKLVAAGFTHRDLGRFIRTYGCVQDRTVRRDGKDVKLNPRKLSGISNRIYPDLLMDWGIFVPLTGVINAEDLPPYEERLLPVELSPEMAKQQKLIDAAIKDEIHRARTLGFDVVSSLIYRYLHVMLSYPDRLGGDLIHGTLLQLNEARDEVIGKHHVHVEVPPLEMEITPKEQATIDLVRQNKAEGRRTLIYVEYTGKRDCAERLRSRLADAGLNVAVMRSSALRNQPNESFVVKAQNREAWIEKHGPRLDALIINPEMVKSGLDLLMFPTILLYQQTANIFTLRQAIRRSWRYGQTKDVRIYFAYYRRSRQEELLTRISSRLDSTLLAEGNATDSDLFRISRNHEGSILRAMARFLEKTALGESMTAMQAPPRIVAGGDEGFLEQNIHEVLARGSVAPAAPVAPVAAAPAPVAAVVPVAAAPAPAPVAKPKAPAKAPAAAAPAGPTAVLVSRLVRERRRTRQVVEVADVTDPEELAPGTQLALLSF